MENQQEELVNMLNDLVSINNDRIEGYQKAMEELEEPKDADVIVLFRERVKESQMFRNELTTSVIQVGGTPTKNSTAPGKLYRTWMDLKTAFTNGSERSVFELCEFGEDAALKAYDKALDKEIVWPDDVFAMLTRQRYTLKVAHDLIKNHRDELKHQST